MKFLIKLNPIYHVLGFFVLIFGGFFISILLIHFSSLKSEIFNQILFGTFFMLPIILEFFYFGWALDYIDKKSFEKRAIKKYIVALILFLSFAFGTYIYRIYVIVNHLHPNVIIVSFFVSLIQLYSLLYIVRYITQRFSFYYSKRKVRILDYFGYLMLLAMIPIGIAIIQTQLKSVIEEYDLKK